MIPLRVWLLIAGLVASLFGAGAAYWQGLIEGKAKCRLEQSEAAAKLEKQVRESNDAIDRKTPFSGSINEQYNFVLRESERFHKARGSVLRAAPNGSRNLPVPDGRTGP